MRALVLCFAVLQLVSGCSFMGYSEIDLPRCQVDSDCLPLGARRGFHPACLKFSCEDGTCVRRRDGEEVHDGFDNDCDGLVDEPGVASDGSRSQTIAPFDVHRIEGVAETARISYSTSPGDTVVAAWAVRESDTGTGWVAQLGSEPGAVEPMSYVRGVAEPGGSGIDPDLHDTDLQPGCYGARGSGIVGGDDLCDFVEVALGVTNGLGDGAGEALVATVNSVGCAAGQLRLGYLELGGAPGVIVRGPLRRSNSYLGVDLTDDGVCTGGNRVEGFSSGIARPAVSVADRDGHSPQALIAWIGDHNQREECGGGRASVEVVGAFLETSSYGGGFGWVTATDEATPQLLGYTEGGGRPGVALLGDVGYLVGFGDGDGNLSLHFLPAPDNPPRYDGYTCCGPEDSHEECRDVELVCAGVEDRTDLEIGPIEGIVSLGSIDPGFGGVVDHVAISVGAVDGSAVEVGIAWLEGCGTSEESIVFRRLVLSARGGVPVAVAETGLAERLAGPLPSDRGVGAPTLAYLDSGFVSDDFERDGRRATEDDLGGWVVVWDDGPEGGGRVVGRRVLALDGRVLDEAERFDLTGPGQGLDARSPALSQQSVGLVFVFHDQAGGALVTGWMHGTSAVGP